MAISPLSFNIFIHTLQVSSSGAVFDCDRTKLFKTSLKPYMPIGNVTFMKSIKDRVGFIVEGTNAAAAIKQIVAADEAGIRQIWMNQAYLDTLTIFAAAATKTSEVCLGTAIVPTYPSHPLALAQQVFERYCTGSVATWNRP
jgi:hypothetical protein